MFTGGATVEYLKRSGACTGINKVGRGKYYSADNSAGNKLLRFECNESGRMPGRSRGETFSSGWHARLSPANNGYSPLATRPLPTALLADVASCFTFKSNLASRNQFEPWPRVFYNLNAWIEAGNKRRSLIKRPLS